MFRKTVWRNTVSDTVSFHQDQALNTTIFLLKSYGPTGFLLKEAGEAKNFKVCLGDPHTCTCPVFHREKEPCKHICWVLMRKFRVPREHEYCFQQGLVERQILEVLHGLHQTRTCGMENSPHTASESPSQLGPVQEDGNVCRKMIQSQDVCPICQEELQEKQLPVSYCRFGCGNNVHISCMKVWADHQALSDKEMMVRCPLCREDFSSLKSLQEQVGNAAKLYTAAEREAPDRHLGVPCRNCRVCPVIGKCFKCTMCSYYYLCEDCFKRGCHQQHQFISRMKRREKWRHVSEGMPDEDRGATSKPVNNSLFPAGRDPLPQHVLGCLPVVRVRPGSRLLDPGLQCRICLQSFVLGQSVRTLPCLHKFHTDCVDGILQKLNSCPLDGYIIYSPLTWSTNDRKTSSKLASSLSSNQAKPPQNNMEDLFIPGLPLLPSHDAPNSKVSSIPLSIPQNLITKRLQGLHINTVDTVSKEGKKEYLKAKTLDRFVFPKNSSSGRLCKCHPGSTQGTCGTYSEQTLAHHRAASPHGSAVAETGEEVHADLFVGSRRPEPDHTPVVTFPALRTRLQPKPRATVTKQDANNRLVSQLSLTGVLINTQQQRKKMS
ncbi:E3 ubiquitin-protein ligase ZSWIM2 [Myripristis murdjan]|uniref:Zinc finger, SWIM-type containing 2 n=1 Tax=Myripristis murdjan TaxID=586833 RepID=A0A667W8H3_9TELE|nr:E3 ubiquitin-protein ligase ZSWIM2 [Myripristis murdjan]XP_029928528.1 E3 ubiquitin-protein ligase ZSWIM2 [Myripristis murdjan]XP_029928536.1 E3 ubiquitin-protein ligase ZSWIM2 [Myripristis murdjan]XP_029928544.1 E3 ubiquitin-protein ligase ZSWIM2 [Myripristis murdjan]XP_029928553.1 E3 ubiquitin-protein ligase ZSWIM2 [Myripristis murdjan]XP_029928562.1 E3 ubiquitin-protein ligase ZSWIM2 [Myripristis murdjan]XP_029928570.1 E3 ubiquitin-protein ligase ZSWIM2 [Myripristis murdjan]XP_02992857